MKLSTLKTNNLQLLDASRNISVSKIAEMNGGFSFRNKIVDGRFDFWYEGTSQTISGYGSDTMWINGSSGSTKVHSMQILVGGVDLPAIDVPTATRFSRTVVTSVAGANNYVIKVHKIEDVRTLAGKTATVSFHTKADSAKPISVSMVQNFGTGGSSPVYVAGKLVSLSSEWSRYSLQFSLPSTSGKTITSDSNLQLMFWFDGGATVVGTHNISGMIQQSGTFDIACVQLEEGSIATPFEELPVEINLARVNRYYEDGTNALIGSAAGAGYFVGVRIPFRQIKRVVPTITYGTPTEYVNIGTFNQTFDTTAILQYVNATAAGNTYISRTFTADARL